MGSSENQGEMLGGGGQHFLEGTSVGFAGHMVCVAAGNASLDSLLTLAIYDTNVS